MGTTPQDLWGAQDPTKSQRSGTEGGRGGGGREGQRAEGGVEGGAEGAEGGRGWKGEGGEGRGGRGREGVEGDALHRTLLPSSLGFSVQLQPGTRRWEGPQGWRPGNVCVPP